jgi:hypothetical protein
MIGGLKSFSSTYVCIIAVLLLMAAAAAAEGGIACGTHLTNVANTFDEILLKNCSSATTVLLPIDASNLTFRVQGGSTVPTFVLPPNSKSASWSNITITIVDVKMTSVHPTTSIVQFSGLRLNGLHLHIYNSSINVTHGVTSLTAFEAIGNSTFLVENSSVVHTELYANNSMCGTYVMSAKYSNLTNVALCIGNISMIVRGHSDIRYKTNCSGGAAWFRLEVSKTHGTVSRGRGTAWNVSVLDSHLKQIAIVNDTTNISAQRDTTTNLTTGSWDYLMFALDAAFLQDVSVALQRVNWSSVVVMVAASNPPQTSMLRIYPSGSSGTVLRDIFVTMRDVYFFVTSTTKPVLLYLSCDNAVHITIQLEQLHGEQVTYGVSPGDDASRTMAVVYLTPTTMNISSITIVNLTVNQTLVSGQGASTESVQASAVMMSASAFVVHMRSNTSSVVIVLCNVTSTVNASGGGFYSYLYTVIPPTYWLMFPRGLDMTLGAVLLGLVYLEPAVSSRSLTLTVESCALHVQQPVSTKAYNTTSSNVLVAALSLMLIMSTCTDCVIVLQNSTLTRPLMSSTFGNCSEASATSALLCVNFTSTTLVQAGDPRNFASVWLRNDFMKPIIDIAAALVNDKGASSLDTLLSQSSLRNVSLTITDSAIYVAPSAGGDPSAQEMPSPLQERADLNVLAYYLLPAHTYGGRVSVHPISSASSLVTPASAVSPDAAVMVGALLVACVGSCTLSDAAVVVASPSPHSPSQDVVGGAPVSASTPHSPRVFVGLRAAFGGLLMAMVLEDSAAITVSRAVFTPREDRYLPISASAKHAQQFGASQLLYALMYALWSRSMPIVNVSRNSRIVLNQSAFYGFEDALRRQQQHTEAFTPTGSVVAAYTFTSGALELGCNLWSSTLATNLSQLRWQLIGLPRTDIVYRPSVFVGGASSSSHVCSGLPTYSESVSVVTPSHQEFPSAEADVNPDASLSSGASGVVAAATAAAVLVALLGGAGGGIAMDAQLLAMFGSSSCAPEALKASTGPSQWLVSPFYLLGSTWIVVGNCAVVGVALLVQVAVVRRLSSRKSHSPPHHPADNGRGYSVKNSSRTDLAPSHRLPPSPGPHTAVTDNTAVLPPRLATSPTSGEPRHMTPFPPWMQHSSPSQHANGAVTWEAACITARFPQLSYSIGVWMVAGVTSSSTTLLTFDGIQHGDAALGVMGGLGLLLVLCGWYGRYVAAQQRCVRRFTFRRYSRRVLNATSWLHPFLLPTGRWFPHTARLTHGFLRSAINPGGLRVLIVPTVASQAAAVVAALPITSASGCVAQWVVQCAIAAGVCTVTVVWRPSRPPVGDVFVVASQVITIAVCALSAARAAPHVTDTSSIKRVNDALCVFVVLASINGVLRSLHRLLLRWWEQNRTQTQTDLAVVSEPPQLSFHDGATPTTTTPRQHPLGVDVLPISTLGRHHSSIARSAIQAMQCRQLLGSPPTSHTEAYHHLSRLVDLAVQSSAANRLQHGRGDHNATSVVLNSADEHMML